MSVSRVELSANFSLARGAALIYLDCEREPTISEWLMIAECIRRGYKEAGYTGEEVIIRLKFPVGSHEKVVRLRLTLDPKS